jgi:diguanylate cyclase (GGDEF)-like protein
MLLDDHHVPPGNGQRQTKAILTGITAFFGISALFILAGASQGARLAQYERVRVLLEASTIRVAIEGNLNERISLERGIVAFVAANTNLDAGTYASFVEVLHMNDPLIMNFALVEGTTIKYVHPLEANKAAIGKDLSQVPEQSEAVQQAKSSREPVVSGPHALVQGGVGVVSRMGIFPIGPAGPEYWGQASVVIDLGQILRRSGVFAHTELVFRLGSKAKSGTEPVLLFGDDTILDDQPVILDINLPGGALWSLATIPKGGWETFRWLAFLVSALGVGIGSLVGFSIFSLMTTRSALRVLAYHDQLTELPNRALFWDRLRVEASRVDRDGTSVCLCMLDLDGFKAVNDDHGHHAGDRLLAGVATRMSAAIRKSDTVARLGGDEFAVIAPVDSTEGVGEVLARLRACFQAPFDLGVVTRISGASIGCAVYPQDGTDVEAVLALADRRMYQEKHAASQ